LLTSSPTFFTLWRGMPFDALVNTVVLCLVEAFFAVVTIAP